MKLWHVPNPWDYHGIGGYVVFSDTAAGAVRKVKAHRRTKDKLAAVRDALSAQFEAERTAQGLTTHGFDAAKAWANYQKAHDCPPFEAYYQTGTPLYESVAEVVDGVFTAEGCDD